MFALRALKWSRYLQKSITGNFFLIHLHRQPGASIYRILGAIKKRIFFGHMECETSTTIDIQAPAGKKMRPSDHAEYDDLVNELADRLKIARHPDASITIRAARLLIENLSPSSPNIISEKRDQLSGSASARMGQQNDNSECVTRIQKSKFSLDDIALPQVAKSLLQVSTSDKQQEKKKDELQETFGHACKALKLLYLDDQKQLQFRVNEIISTIQSVTANPKTDPKLLATGR